jgi:hypothetical protein
MERSEPVIMTMLERGGKSGTGFRRNRIRADRVTDPHIQL